MKALEEEKKVLRNNNLSELSKALKETRHAYQMYLFELDSRKEKNTARKDYFRKKIAIIMTFIKERLNEKQ
jgi:ribosomal protein L29